MRHRRFTEGDFAGLFAEATGQSVERVRIVSEGMRRYSSVWFLDVLTGSGVVHVVAKYRDVASAFERQSNVLRLARGANAGDEGVCIPYLGSLPRERLVFMERVFAPTVDSLCRWSLQNVRQARNLHGLLDRLEAACSAMGRWLRKWHEGTRESRPTVTDFERYLARRGECVSVLAVEDRRRLSALVGRMQPGITAASHGDFTPANVLWSGRGLTVLDFGISEWEHASPWWDRACMEIGLAVSLRFSIRGLGAWFPTWSDAAIAAFRDGYGECERDDDARLASMAIRHLVLYTGDLCSGKRYWHRAEWHHRQLRQLLANVSD